MVGTSKMMLGVLLREEAIVLLKSELCSPLAVLQSLSSLHKSTALPIRCSEVRTY